MRLEGKNICFKYASKGRDILKDINISINEGERVGLIGPSGFGKSTLAKILAGYLRPSQGKVVIDGKPLPEKGYCPVQLIYQHPEKALNPRWRLKDSLFEGNTLDQELLDAMGIEREWLNRWPNELSGGELQRFCVARVLGEKTKFLIADEISTMLDVITQAQLWSYILERAQKNNLGLLVVTHNQDLAQKVCTRMIHLPDINGLEQ